MNYTGLVEYYIPNYYNNLSGWDGSDVFYQFTDYSVPLVQNIQFNISRSYEWYINTNQTSGYQFSKYGLTSALATNGTSLCNGSSSNLAQNSGQINITLSPSEPCWVFDNYATNNWTNYNTLIATIGQSRADSLYGTYGWTIPTAYTGDLLSSCSQLTRAFSDMLPWLGIIMFVLAAGIVITIIMMGGFEVNLFAIIAMICGIGFLTIMTIVIIGGILGC